MNCAQRNCVYVVMAFFACVYNLSATGKGAVNRVGEPGSKYQFQWREHTKLSWDDFKGAVNAPHDQSAAATCCSIGFKTKSSTPGGKPEIIVYNTFYVNRSWVQPDGKEQYILDHEQGHFDLCEIYTRKLKDRVRNFDLNAPGAKQALMNIYAQVSSEYETRQQAYEQETTHGTNLAKQRKWQEAIANELM